MKKKKDIHKAVGVKLDSLTMWMYFLRLQIVEDYKNWQMIFRNKQE